MIAKHEIALLPLFLGIILVVLADVLYADKAAGQGDSQKQELRTIMQSIHFVPRIGKDLPFCKAFYDDFRRQRGISYVQPIIKAQKYDDPALKPYQKQCPKLRMDKTMTFKPKDITVAGVPQTEEEAEARAISVNYGLTNFQLYEVDINNNAKDGQEYVFYYEGAFDKKHDKTYPAPRTYQVVDFKACKMTYGTSLNAVGSEKWTRNSIIRYGNKHYVFALMSAPGRTPSYYSLSLYGYSPEKDRLLAVCSYGLPLNMPRTHKGGK